MHDQQKHPEQQIKNLADQPLPDYSQLMETARSTASEISIGQSLFLKTHGCTSELDYKRQCMRDGRIMYHAHIGMNDMDSTARGLRELHRHLDQQGFRMDRAGFALDRRMGLPSDLWVSTAAETGPMLENQQDWSALAQSAPIQPHLGDFMIGQPASFSNTVQALRIGCTTVGNLSQFFTFEAPGWDDQLATSVETLKAITLLSEFREQGTMLHSYLEDGYGALFKQCATVAAWAMLEYYIVEELLGAKLSHCIGGLTSDPIKRAGWVLALQKIHRGDQVGSMIYGDTISFGSDFDKNRAVVSEYLLWDILMQMYSPSGHAVLPLPVTEAIRIPSAEEIIEAQCFGRQIEQSARRLYPHVNFSAAEAFADRVCRDGKVIFDNALSGLKQCGVDLSNPLQLLYVLKRIGAQTFEGLFAKNTQSCDPTDMYLLSQQVIDNYRPMFESSELIEKVKGKRLMLASTDVHEHAIGALAQLLSEAGAEVTNLGSEQSPDQVAESLSRHHYDALLLSTHNGMALDYGKQLRLILDKESIDLPVLMGGVLNQKVENEALPVDVVDDLKQLGINPAVGLPNLSKLLSSQ
ncbi:MAG: cobalamin-dependent protein [Gammaproteobacteria bacterium]|nr:cobalamin-dependent protein [Gammaproteobacteria bacterium]